MKKDEGIFKFPCVLYGICSFKFGMVGRNELPVNSY